MYKGEMISPQSNLNPLLIPAKRYQKVNSVLTFCNQTFNQLWYCTNSINSESIHSKLQPPSLYRLYIISQHSLLIWLSLVNCVECIKYTKEYEDGKRAAVVQHIGYCVSRYVITKLSTGGCCCCYVYLFYEKFVSGRAHLTFLHRFHRSRNLSERYTSTYKRSINSGLRCWTLFVSKNFRSVLLLLA